MKRFQLLAAVLVLLGAMIYIVSQYGSADTKEMFDQYNH